MPEAMEVNRQAKNGEYEIIGDIDAFDKYVGNVVVESSKD